MRALEVKPNAIILEPFGRNTAPAISIAAMKAIADENDSILLILPADHDIKNKENFLIKLRLNFPELSVKQIEKNLNKEKYFYLKKRITQSEKEKLWTLGEKGIIFEPFQSRIYTHSRLFSHVIGQVDYDNYGVSGVEKYFDK